VTTPAALRRVAHHLVWSLGLQELVFRARERRLAQTRAKPLQEAGDANLPPPLLRVRVCGHPDPYWFLDGAQRTITEFDGVLRTTGGGFAETRAVLDLGCGCGRLARWLPGPPERLTGLDIDPELVGWCTENLAGTYGVTPLNAPIAAPDGRFDLVYACSVITHLRRTTAQACLTDVARVLQPGGRALITFHDERHRDAPPVAEALARDGFAVRFDSLEGSNLLASFVTLQTLIELAAPALTLLTAVPSDETVFGQAIAVFGKPAAASA
jgi:SAM-dependent methyltransferase